MWLRLYWLPQYLHYPPEYSPVSPLLLPLVTVCSRASLSLEGLISHYCVFDWLFVQPHQESLTHSPVHLTLIASSHTLVCSVCSRLGLQSASTSSPWLRLGLLSILSLFPWTPLRLLSILPLFSWIHLGSILDVSLHALKLVPVTGPANIQQTKQLTCLLDSMPCASLCGTSGLQLELCSPTKSYIHDKCL